MANFRMSIVPQPLTDGGRSTWLFRRVCVDVWYEAGRSKSRKTRFMSLTSDGNIPDARRSVAQTSDGLLGGLRRRGIKAGVRSKAGSLPYTSATSMPDKAACGAHLDKLRLSWTAVDQYKAASDGRYYVSTSLWKTMHVLAAVKMVVSKNILISCSPTMREARARCFRQNRGHGY